MQAALIARPQNTPAAGRAASATLTAAEPALASPSLPLDPVAALDAHDEPDDLPVSAGNFHSGEVAGIVMFLDTPDPDPSPEVVAWAVSALARDPVAPPISVSAGPVPPSQPREGPVGAKEQRPWPDLWSVPRTVHCAKVNTWESVRTDCLPGRGDTSRRRGRGNVSGSHGCGGTDCGRRLTRMSRSGTRCDQAYARCHQRCHNRGRANYHDQARHHEPRLPFAPSRVSTHSICIRTSASPWSTGLPETNLIVDVGQDGAGPHRAIRPNLWSIMQALSNRCTRDSLGDCGCS
jgi:hypothetical protein